MNHWLVIRLICLRVVTSLMKDCHGNEIEVTYINDWLSIKLICL